MDPVKLSRPRQPRGFTLVELLVVIGIIAVLIAILLPSLARARSTAQRVTCGSNMRQIGQAFMLYVSANDNYIPAANFSTVDQWDAQPQLNWDVALHPYLGYRYIRGQRVNVKVMRCPSDTNIEAVSWFPEGDRKSYTMVQTQGPNERGRWSALGTGRLIRPATTASTASVLHEWLKITSVRQASRTILLAESVNEQNVQASPERAFTFITGLLDTPWQHERSTVYRLHQGSYNYLMTDGSVQFLAPRETVRPGYAMPAIDATQYNPGGMWTVRSDD